MNDIEYREKVFTAKNQSERDNINNEFIKSKVRKNKFNKFKKYFKDNLLPIIALIIAIIGLFT